LHPLLKSKTPRRRSSPAKADEGGLFRPRYPLRKETTEEAEEVIELDRTRFDGAVACGNASSACPEKA
jgi:hypothetical protein